MIFGNKNIINKVASGNGNHVMSQSGSLWLRKLKNFEGKALLSTSILVFLLILFFGLIFGYYSSSGLYETKIKGLNREISDIERKSADLERKTSSSEKFIEISRNLPSRQKKTKGMSVREAQALFESLKDKYNIRDLQIQLSTPVELKGDFTRDTVKTITSEVVLSFNATLDTDVKGFFNEIKEQLTGYIVITKYNMRRTRAVDDIYIKEIYRGEWPTSLSGQIVFRWYVLS